MQTPCRENRESCENRERYRHCEHPYDLFDDESQSLAKAEKAEQIRCKKQQECESGELLRVASLMYGRVSHRSSFVAKKREQHTFLCAAFVFLSPLGASLSHFGVIYFA